MGCSNSKVDPGTTIDGSKRDEEEKKIDHVRKGIINIKKTHTLEPIGIDSIYELKEELGKGAFSVVRKGVNRESGQFVAVKCVNRDNLPQEDEEALHTEVSILRHLHHKNIVQFIDFFTEPEFYYLVMEYMAGGELFNRIVEKIAYQENEAREVVIGLLSAVKYCHELNVAHRDLKPENLLLVSTKDDSNVKLADFGFATYCYGSSLTQRCGSPQYVAPEILSNAVYGKAVDMWSLGVITFSLLGGYPPFDDREEHRLFDKIRSAQFSFHPKYWNHVSKEAKDFITRLLVADPYVRMSAEAALWHPWLVRAAIPKRVSVFSSEGTATSESPESEFVSDETRQVSVVMMTSIQSRIRL